MVIIMELIDLRNGKIFYFCIIKHYVCISEKVQTTSDCEVYKEKIVNLKSLIREKNQLIKELQEYIKMDLDNNEEPRKVTTKLDVDSDEDRRKSTRSEVVLKRKQKSKINGLIFKQFFFYSISLINLFNYQMKI